MYGRIYQILAGFLLAGLLWVLCEQALVDGSAYAQPLYGSALSRDDVDLASVVPRELTSLVRLPPGPLVARGSSELEWLQDLARPDFAAPLTEPVVAMLERIRAGGVWRSRLARWLERAGRYETMVRRILQQEGLPGDLVYVSMIESGFDTRAKSRAGATGLWQFMPRLGRAQGLRQDRWVDERLDPERATRAAARTLRSFHERLGTWELAFAAYNMGLYGLLASVRGYNSNDYWLLRKYEFALPQETRHYVPRIMATAIAAKNPERFGLTGLTPEAPVEGELVPVPRPQSLPRLARRLGISAEQLRELNPELRRDRTPRQKGPYRLRVPLGRGADAAAKLQRLARGQRQHQVRRGEDLSSIARTYGVSQSDLAQLNGVSPDERPEPGAFVALPESQGRRPSAEAEVVPVVLPARHFVYPQRRRVFYQVRRGDQAAAVAQAFGVQPEELWWWNDLEPEARLQPGMVLQVFVPLDFDLSALPRLADDQVQLLTAGTEELYEAIAARRNRKRIVYQARSGDSLRRLARRFDLSVGLIARMNQFSRRHELAPGEEVVLYVEPNRLPRRRVSRAASRSPSRRAD
jgi:membrane-bound lytic murein transglycosylase D